MATRSRSGQIIDQPVSVDNRPVCQQSQCTNEKVCNLEMGSRMCLGRCNVTPLVGGAPLHISTSQFVVESPLQDQDGEDNSSGDLSRLGYSTILQSVETDDCRGSHSSSRESSVGPMLSIREEPPNLETFETYCFSGDGHRPAVPANF